MKFYTS